MNAESAPPNVKRRQASAPQRFQSNVEAHLNEDPLQGCVGYCDLTGVPVVRNGTPWGSQAHTPWSDHDMLALRSWIETTHDWSPTDSHLRGAVELAARKNRFHPIREYLAGLSWDGGDRISKWLTTHFGVEDSPYTQAVGRKFLIAAVARVMKPGCKSDHILVLEGNQGIGKSSGLRALMPQQEWFRDTPLDLYNKDAYLGLLGAWLIEFAELETMSRASVSRIKVFASSAEDVYRRPYDRTTVRQLRQCLFVATTNEYGYLKDDSGNRRFWPVRCGDLRVNLDQLRQERDQLWAEAFQAFQLGETWYLGAVEEALAKAEQEKRREPDPLEYKLAEYLFEKTEVTMDDLLSAVGASKSDTNVRGTLAIRLRRIIQQVHGWTKTRKRTSGGLRGYVFVRPGYVADDPEARIKRWDHIHPQNVDGDDEEEEAQPAQRAQSNSGVYEDDIFDD